MLLVTTALSGLMAGVIQSAPPQAAPAQSAQQQPGAAQPQDPEDAETPVAVGPVGDGEVTDLGTINVTGVRARGSVNSDIPPDVVLSAEEIQAYGASTIEELLTYLEPLTRSSRGRGGEQPITLVNGRRISGFQEISNIPPEAIERVDILPEEVALEYGYRADQRVVNFVLKSNFQSMTGQIQTRLPTEGGRTNGEVSGNVLRISGASRWSLDAEYERSTPLFETERDIVRTPGSTPYDLIGNVTGSPFETRDPVTGELVRTEIDPALSALVGQRATTAPVPVVPGAPTLGDFASAYGAPRSGDLSAYRTLLSATEETQLRGTLKRDINSSTAGTFSFNLQDNNSRSFNGLPGVAFTLPEANPFSPFDRDAQVFHFIDDSSALARETDTLTGRLAVLLDGFIGEEWRWTLNGTYDRVETDTTTGRGLAPTPFQARLSAGDPTANPFGALTAADLARIPNDTANSVSQNLSAELTLNGDLFELPAGDVSSTLTFGASSRSLDSTSTRLGVVTDRSQSRDRLNGQANLNLPLTDTVQGILPQFGDLSLNVNAGYEDLSDFGGLHSLDLGLNWQPLEPLSFVFSYTDEQGAPSISQLNDPILSTPNVPVFDFLTGETVLVTRIDGGNPDLEADNRRVYRVSGSWTPFSEQDLRFQSTWTRSVVDDPINSFPTITPELEAALPERFTRNADGDLLSFDARALNFDRAERQDIRTGFNFSKAFGTPRLPTAPAAGAPGAPAGAGAAPGGPRPGGGMRGGGGGGVIIMSGPGGGGDGPRAGGGRQERMVMGGGGGRRGGQRGGGMQPGQGRFFISAYHTYRIQDEIVIREGLPVLDLLDGSATSSQGGSPRNEVQLQGGMFKDGMGAFLNANWRESTRIDGGTGPDLTFADRTTVNLNVFMDLGARESWVARYPWLKGTRINLGVQNLFDSEIEVTSSAGDTPVNYQPDFLDPQGRTVSIQLRKILF